MHVFGLAFICLVFFTQIKLATVQLARNYMKRVAGELDASTASAVQDPQREFLLLQGVRFAFRVHQVINPFLFSFPIQFLLSLIMNM